MKKLGYTSFILRDSISSDLLIDTKGRSSAILSITRHCKIVLNELYLDKIQAFTTFLTVEEL